PRIAGSAGGEVLRALFERCRPIGDRVPFHHSCAGRVIFRRRMRFEAVAAPAERLPDTGEVRLAACISRNSRPRRRRRACSDGVSQRQNKPQRRKQSQDALAHFSAPGASGFDEPANRFRPSGNCTLVPLTVAEPRLARKPLTSSSTPVGKSVLRRPRRRSAFGAPNSTAQFVTFPSSPFTSM